MMNVRRQQQSIIGIQLLVIIRNAPRLEVTCSQMPPVDKPSQAAPSLDFLEILGTEWLRPVEIVIKAGVDRWPDAELRLRKQFEHGCSAKMRGGVTVNFECRDPAAR